MIITADLLAEAASAKLGVSTRLLPTVRARKLGMYFRTTGKYCGGKERRSELPPTESSKSFKINEEEELES